MSHRHPHPDIVAVFKGKGTNNSRNVQAFMEEFTKIGLP
jgi:hypothetical protein